MQFQLGSTYEFKGKSGVTIVLEFKDVTDEYYVCVVKGGNMLTSDELGQIKHIRKTSRILNSFECNQVGGLIGGKSSGVVRKRRTPDEIQVDNLIEHVQRNIEIDQLNKAIDKALEINNKELFMSLTKELNKLRKKVTV